MNIIKNKIMLSAIALMLVIAGSAFKFQTASSKVKTFVYWHYTGNSMADVRDESKYVLTSSPAEEACDDQQELPCILRVDSSIGTSTDLHNYLNNTGIFPTNQDVLDAATATKSITP